MFWLFDLLALGVVLEVHAASVVDYLLYHGYLVWSALYLVAVHVQVEQLDQSLQVLQLLDLVLVQSQLLHVRALGQSLDLPDAVVAETQHSQVDQGVQVLDLLDEVAVEVELLQLRHPAHDDGDGRDLVLPQGEHLQLFEDGEVGDAVESLLVEPAVLQSVNLALHFVLVDDGLPLLLFGHDQHLLQVGDVVRSQLLGGDGEDHWLFLLIL